MTTSAAQRYKFTNLMNLLILLMSSLAIAGEPSSHAASPKLDSTAVLEGSDTNNNGIRDDVDAYLASKNFPVPKLKAAQQEARVYQDQLTVNPTNKTALHAVELRADKSTNCMFSKFGGSAMALSKELLKLTANTIERKKAYSTYEHFLDGTVASLPDGDTCE